jgi:hypothetical protein
MEVGSEAHGCRSIRSAPRCVRPFGRFEVGSGPWTNVAGAPAGTVARFGGPATRGESPIGEPDVPIGGPRGDIECADDSMDDAPRSEVGLLVGMEGP